MDYALIISVISIAAALAMAVKWVLQRQVVLMQGNRINSLESEIRALRSKPDLSVDTGPEPTGNVIEN
jgi:hypothetical protein